MARTLLAHGTGLIERGFLTSAPDRTRARDGTPTNALFATCRALRTAIGFKTPDRAIALVDPFGEVDDALAPQVPHAKRLLEALGLMVVDVPDALATIASYARAAREAGDDVVIAGSDKRFAQLVSDRLRWYDAYKDVRYTPELVKKRFEVDPALVAEWLALVGDDDHLPGVKGIGKKGATALLTEHGSVEAAYAALDTLDTRTRKALAAGIEDARREVGRARLATDAALPIPFGELTFDPDDDATVAALYDELGLVELLPAEELPTLGEVAIPGDLEAALSALDRARPTAVEIVTEDPSPIRGALVGVALAQSDRAPLYVPMVDRDVRGAELAPLVGWLEDAAIPKTGHDTKAARVAFAKLGVALRGVVSDSECESHLHEPSNLAPHDLSLLVKHFLRRALPAPESLRGVGKGTLAWSEVPEANVAAYAAERASCARAIAERLLPDTDPALLAEYLALGDTLVRMELRGIAVDREDLLHVGADFERIAAELEGEIHALAGDTFNIGSTKQLGHVLFEQLGLPIYKRTKTGWSTATEALERIEHAHPIVPLVIRWRLLTRLTDSWVTALEQAIELDGRVRSTFDPARSFSGRLVNSAPDLGRVPGRTKEMARIRRAFAAPEGKTILSLDYRQLGLYVLAHLSRDPALCGPLARGEDLHAITAAAVLELPIERVGRDERQRGKVVNFATFAGQGPSALAMQLNVGVEEAKTLIDRFDRHYAKVRAFQDEQLELVRTRGYVTTIAGRRWPVTGLDSPDVMGRSYAERLARRATHEGSVADVSRRGLLRADEALREAGLDAAPLLQVHDEVLFEVAPSDLAEAARIGARAMREAFALEVPLRVGAKAGPSWADLEPLALE
ncbi:MAG: DNA polymerase [Sandaracinaceae bacterium]